MATVADVVAGVRQKMRDFPKMFQTDIPGDGLAQIFEMPVIMVDPMMLNVVLHAQATPPVPTSWGGQTDTIQLNGTNPTALSQLGIAIGSVVVTDISGQTTYQNGPDWGLDYQQFALIDGNIGVALDTMYISRSINTSTIPDGGTVNVTYNYLIAEGTPGGGPQDITLAPDTDYTLDAHHGMLMLLGRTLPTGDTLSIFGTHYEWFLDSDIESETGWYIQGLETSQSNTGYFDALAPDDPVVELTERGVLLACLWSLLIETSLDIDVRNPEGVDIPTSQRFAHLQNLVDQWTTRYQELASRLNVGIDAISVWTLRRLSYTTGRLVPLYVEQEFDDRATPLRMYPPIPADQGPHATPQRTN